MTKLSDKTWRIIKAFERFIKDRKNPEIKHYTIEDLKAADVELGNTNVNAPHRLEMKNRIKELEGRKEGKVQRKKAIINDILVPVVIAIIIILVSVLLWYYS